MTAGQIMIAGHMESIRNGKNATISAINMGLTIFVIACVCSLVLIAVARWVSVWMTGGRLRKLP